MPLVRPSARGGSVFCRTQRPPTTGHAGWRAGRRTGSGGTTWGVTNCDGGRLLHDPPPNGPLPHAPVPHEPVPNRPLPNEPASDEPPSHGLPRRRAAPSAPRQSGNVQNGDILMRQAFRKNTSAPVAHVPSRVPGYLGALALRSRGAACGGPPGNAAHPRGGRTGRDQPERSSNWPRSPWASRGPGGWASCTAAGSWGWPEGGASQGRRPSASRSCGA